MKYIDAEKLIAEIDSILSACTKQTHTGVYNTCHRIKGIIASLQQEQPMPNSTQLIELWHKDKEILKEKDFRNDPWRLAYNAFMCGFGRGLAVKQEQPEVDLEKELNQWRHKHSKGKRDDDYCGEYLERESQFDLARHFYELGLNSRKED